MLRLLAAEGMVSLGTLSLDGAKLAGNAAQKLNRTLPQIEEILAEAAVADVAGPGSSAESATRRALARRDAQRARQEARDAAAAAGKRRGRRPSAEPPRANRAAPGRGRTPPARDVRVMPNQKGYVPGYNGQLVTDGQVIIGAMLSRHPVGRTLLHPLLDT